MKRAIVHALCIVALAGLGWAIRLTESYPLGPPWEWLGAELEILGLWGWAPAALGCLGLALCFVACLVEGRRRGSWLPVLLVAPGLCLALSAALFYVEIRQLVSTFAEADVRNGNYNGAVEWLSGRAYFAQILLARGTRWAALSLAGAAIAAGCTAAPDRDGPDGLRLGWPVVTIGAVLIALTVYVFGYARIFRSIGEGPLQWGAIGRSLDSITGAVPLLVQLPVIAGLLVLLILPLVLMNLRPHIAEIRRQPTKALDSARATAAAATLGAGVAFGLGAWLSASAGATQITYWALAASFEARHHLVGVFSGYSSSLSYIAGGPLSLATLAVAVAVAAPLLVTSLRAWPRWIVPVAFVTIPWLLFAGIRAAALPHISRHLDPHCCEQCTELDRIAALLTLSRLQDNRQIIRDQCGKQRQHHGGRLETTAKRRPGSQARSGHGDVRIERHGPRPDSRLQGQPGTDHQAVS